MSSLKKLNVDSFLQLLSVESIFSSHHLTLLEVFVVCSRIKHTQFYFSSWLVTFEIDFRILFFSRKLFTQYQQTTTSLRAEEIFTMKQKNAENKL